MSKLVYNKYSPDKKDISILLSFLIWLIVGFCIIFVGINNVFAEEVAYSNATFRVKECGSDEWSNWTNATQKLSVYSINNLGFRLYFNNTQLTGNTYYNITVTYNFYTEAPSINVMNAYGKSTFYYNTTASESGNIQGNNNNYSVRFEKDTENTNLIKAVYNVLIPVNSKFIAFNINWDNPNNDTCRTLSDGFTISNIKVESLNDTQAIVDGNNANTENIINNNNQNTQDIINNQNQNNEDLKDTIKDQFNECRESVNLIDKNLFQLGNVYYYYMYLDNPNELYTLSIKLKENGTPKNIYIGFSENNLPPINNYTWLLNNGEIQGSTGNDNFKYIRNYSLNIYRKYVIIYLNNYTMDDLFDNYYIQLQKGMFTQYEEYGKEICSNKIDETNDKLNNIDDTLNNSDTTGATNDASNFFSNFTTDTFGLTSVITAPLNIINSITTSSCIDLNLPLPYLNNKYITLPCMNSIYTRYFGVFFSLYQTITFGIVSYWVIVRIFNQVKDFKNPEHDEIEVLDL